MVSFIGYLASIFLGISLLVNNDLKFRWINTLGCFTFVIYGLFIAAYPIIFTNALLFFINVFYLVKIYRTDEAFDILEYKDGDNIISRFIEFYNKDIQLYFPLYLQHRAQSNIRFVVLRNMVIANIFEASLQPNGTAIIRINYTVPKYRDYKVGKFIFDKEKAWLTGRGVQHILYETIDNKNHEQFLKKMGFKKNAGSFLVKPLV